MTPLDFITIVALVCGKHRSSVSSWGRTPKRNREVGGSPNSLHMLWIGCDIVLDVMMKNAELEEDCGRFGLTAIYEKDHYHLQPK